jgi:sulfotransferase family protein
MVLSQMQPHSSHVDSHEMASLAPVSRRIPDFFIVGQPKSGTTALYEALRRHPQIYMPVAKEPNFFSSEWQKSDGPAETLDDYSTLFAAAEQGQRIGEASVFYLSSATAAQAIAKAQPTAQIIAVLREPASLLRSLHLQFVQSDFEPERDLRKALALEPDRRKGRHVPPTAGSWRRRLLYSEHLRYVEQLRRYYEFFPAEQIMVIVYDDYRQDNDATLRAVLRFLEVDDAFPVIVEETNPTVRVRSRYLNHIRHREEGLIWRLATTMAKTFVPRRSRVKLRQSWPHVIYGAAPPPDERLMVELRSRFEPEVVSLSEYLKRDIEKLWGYDTVD